MHSNRPYEAGRAKAKQDLGLHPVQPPAPWTQEVDKRLRVRTGSAMEKDPSEKRAYGLKDVLGDALAAGTAGYRQHAENLGDAAERVDADARHTEESRFRDWRSRTTRANALKEKLDTAPRRADRQDQMADLAETPGYNGPPAGVFRAYARELRNEIPTLQNEYTDHINQANEAERVYRGAVRSAGAAAAANRAAQDHARNSFYTSVVGGAAPIGSHYIATPIVSTIGQLVGGSVARGYGAGPGGRIAGAALGSLAGRTALRGFDTLRERWAKKKETPAEEEKTSFEGADKLPGGPADRKNPSDFDPKELRKGQQHEMEHTTDPSLAREIASDHLVEHPRYYEQSRSRA